MIMKLETFFWKEQFTKKKKKKMYLLTIPNRKTYVKTCVLFVLWNIKSEFSF